MRANNPRKTALRYAAVLIALGSYHAGTQNAADAHKPRNHGVHVPANLTRSQCAPSATPCHKYVPVKVSGPDIRVDCDHANVWCDDEGA